MPPKLTQPLRPVQRYRKGKAPVPSAALDSESDDDEQQQQQEAAGQDEDAADEEELTELAQPRNKAAGGGGRINVALREVEVDKGGKVKVGGRDEVGRTEMESSEGEYETDSEEEAQPPPKPAFRSKAAPAPAVAEESSEYETDSEEEEEEPLKPIYKPVFVSKRNRDTTVASKPELDPAALAAKHEEEQQKQRDASKNLVADSIHRELAQKEAQATQPDVDDTDGLDPEGEFEAWKLRELMRLKRDREARYALEKVREEVEARRQMPEELRLKEDTERAAAKRKEKEQNKGQKAFLDKYHHKGVFHQDLDILKKRDYQAPTASSVVDVSSLPAVMQKRNFGKAHQTKYTHLADQDTSRQSGGWGKDAKPRPGGGGFGGAGGGAGGEGCFNCGGPHLKRDCPQLDLSANGGAGAGPSGANSSSLSGAPGGSGGWGARAERGPPPDEQGSADRYAPSARSSAPGGGRRGGPGIGYGSGGPGGQGGGAGRRDERDWRDRGDRDRPRSRERRRSRSRSRSPPRYRSSRDDDRYRRDDRDDRYASRAGMRDDERDKGRRSRSPPPRRRENDREGRDRRDERDAGGRDREDKRRRVDYD
ncbi:hypothetical protein JCM11251_007527 [Rhodosporidiobolus azoricus]